MQKDKVIVEQASKQYDSLMWLGIGLLLYFLGAMSSSIFGTPFIGLLTGTAATIYALWLAIRKRQIVQAISAALLLAAVGYVCYVVFWIMRNWQNI